MRRIISAAIVLAFAGTLSAQQPAEPTDEHKKLAEMAGTWDATVIHPGGEIPPMKGAMVYKMEMGGLWLIGRFESEFMGVKFTGTDTTGYDPIKKKYVGTWVDSMSPTMMTSSGKFDKKTGMMVMKGTAGGPDGKIMQVKSTVEMKGKDEMVMKMYQVVDKEEKHMMSVEYKRKK